MASLCIATTSLQASASPNSVRQGTGGLRTSTRSAGTVMRSVQLGHAHMLIKTTASLAAVSKSTTTKLKTSSRITRAGQTTANTQCLTTDFNGDCPSGNQSVTYNGGALVKNPAVYVVTFSTSSNSLTSTDTSGYVATRVWRHRSFKERSTLQCPDLGQRGGKTNTRRRITPWVPVTMQDPSS